MPFLDGLKHEFKPGYIPSGSPLVNVVKQPDMDLGNGMTVPGGQTVVTHQPQRPSFITAYLQSLPSALAGALQGANQPYSGFASGLGGGAAQIQKDKERSSLIQHNQDQETFENKIRLQQLGISQEHVKLERDRVNAEKHYSKTETDLAVAAAGGDEGAKNALAVLKEQREKPEKEKSPKTISTGEGVFILNEDGTLGTRLGSTPAQAAAGSMPNIPLGSAGDDVLKRLPPAEAALVKKLANYEINPQSLSVRGGHRERLLALTSIYDPSYDMTQYSAKASLRKDFTSGGAAKNIRALNTAVGHLGQLNSAIGALNNDNIQGLNRVANKFSVQVGQSAPVMFNAIKNAVTGELATTFKGSGATDQEISHMNETLSSAQSPQQVRDVVKTYVGLLNSRLNALQEQYQQGIGKPSEFKILHPESEHVIQQINGGGESGAMQVGQTITLKNGKTVTIKAVHPDGSFDAE